MILWYALVACLAHIAGGKFIMILSLDLVFLANYIQILMATSSYGSTPGKSRIYSGRISGADPEWKMRVGLLFL